MGFSESTKLTVKRKADFTCCWCRDRLKKVDVHHIVSEADGGPDDEDNAAPLCESCHGLFGDNPRLKKEIKLRRDQWYEICSKVMNPGWGWPIGLDVPLLEFVREIAPTSSIPASGIQFTDKNPTDASNPPLLYLSIYFKRNRYFGQYLPPGKEKWLYLEANMRFAFNLRLQVRALNDRCYRSWLGIIRGVLEDNRLPPQ
jgi:HNH endonuclease